MITMPSEFTAEQLQDLQARVSAGKLTPEEEKYLLDVARTVGQSVGQVLNDLGQVIAKLGPQIQATGAQMDQLSGLAAAMKRPFFGKPLDRWSTTELMAYLPAMAKDCEDFSKLTDFQFACLVQHCLNNCSQKDAITYDGALQLKYGPELVKRIAARPVDVRATRMRAAWALYRSGGATLEEISLVFDEALEELEESEE